MSDEDKKRIRVGDAVRDRRLRLRMDQADLAKEAEVDVKTVRSLEKGERWPRDSSRTKIEAALGWVPGTLGDLMQGLQPRSTTPEKDAILREGISFKEAFSKAADARPQASTDVDEESVEYVVRHLKDSAKDLKSRGQDDPYAMASAIIELTATVRESFLAAQKAMALGAAPDEADRFLDGALGLLITSGALGLVGTLEDPIMHKVLAEFSEAKADVRANRESRKLLAAQKDEDRTILRNRTSGSKSSISKNREKEHEESEDDSQP
ncbi:helix-turn-helix domain-containing protein [Rhodococcus qingshengii]|uniref:helix-turn-helix domain-containing protein n=1 Tax=Rhodococcus TaxID=1827 RepID=UPI000F61F3EC|nr:MULTISPECIES: helix-turn-helix domain-containing protein [Rhodococcus]AZI62758.1 helix-turn-helix domain-containing protein [Rhodococcus sp. NJ-530]BDQ21099.1 helix-turn-helix domain-containing protein [Rhodococcus qingshengii]